MRVASSLGFALALTLVPRGAAADCGDCYSVTSVRPIFGASIPADGVLGFTYEGELPGLYPWTATLRRVDGEAAEVEVAVESAGPRWIVVRPLAPLLPGDAYEVTVHVDLALDEACTSSMNQSLQWSFTAAPPGLSSPTPPPLEVTFSVFDEPRGDEAIVCCDKGASFNSNFCGGPLPEGCAATVGTGTLHIDARVDPSAWDPQGQVVFADFEVGATEASWDRTDPVCVTPTAIHLATGERAEGPEICPEAALRAEVRDKDLDPTEILECRPLWTCGDAVFGWDPRMCRRWHRSGGCHCSTGEEGGHDLSLVLFSLGLVVTRRRRGSGVAGRSAGAPRRRSGAGP